MALLLEEKSPREWTWVYGMHRFRAMLRHRAGALLPQFLAGVYGLLGVVAVWPIVHLWQAAVLAGLAAGALAALGMTAIWSWFSARLYTYLDTHPQAQDEIKAGYRMPPRPVFDAPALILGEAHTEREYDNEKGSYKLIFDKGREVYSPTPEWSVVPAKALVTGLLVLGNTGTGKTSYVLRPSVFKLFHHPTKPGGLVMDSKASLVEPLAAEMALAARADDLLLIGPRQLTKWNPFNQPLVSASTLADQMLTTIENIAGAPFQAESRWIRNGAAILVEGVIIICRLAANDVSAGSIRTMLQQLQLATSGSDTPGKEAHSFLTTLASATDIDTSTELYEHGSSLIISRMAEDEKFRSIYISELTTLLVPLTSPGVSLQFNAPAAECDMPSWADIVNTGKVICLDCNQSVSPTLSLVLGTLLKLGYQNCILARPDLHRQGLVNMDRYMALVIDEYQEYASVADPDYLAQCRESRSITVFLTQGPASIIEKLGKERTDVLVQSMLNRLVLRQNNPEYAADMLGQDEVEERDRQISESTQGAGLRASGRFAGDSTVSESVTVRRNRKHVVPPELLASLPVGHGVLQAYDGNRVIPIHRVHLLPYFNMDSRSVDLKG